jgi:LemA protein
MNRTGCIVAAVVVLLLALVVGGWLSGQYNGLVASRETVNEAWAQVDNVYQRRLDLIPNLVETVKGVANFERETYTAVAEARSRAGQMRVNPDQLDDPEVMRRFEESQGQLTSALSRLFAVAENYPQLKANQNFLELQSQLEGTENRIAVERRRFNEVAREYNTRVSSVPTNLVAGLFGFRPRPYFESSEGADRAPQVKF